MKSYLDPVQKGQQLYLDMQRNLVLVFSELSTGEAMGFFNTPRISSP